MIKMLAGNSISINYALRLQHGEPQNLEHLLKLHDEESFECQIH